MTLHAMHGQFCSHCGEGIWDEESYRRYTEAQEGLVRAVKGDPGADIRRIRKKLNITQAKLALAFGVGKVAFSRYERGETRPSGLFAIKFSLRDVPANNYPSRLNGVC